MAVLIAAARGVPTLCNLARRFSASCSKILGPRKRAKVLEIAVTMMSPCHFFH